METLEKLKTGLELLIEYLLCGFAYICQYNYVKRENGIVSIVADLFLYRTLASSSYSSRELESVTMSSRPIKSTL